MSALELVVATDIESIRLLTRFVTSIVNVDVNKLQERLQREEQQ